MIKGDMADMMIKEILGKHYTRIMLSSFVFIICADLFFIIISIVKGAYFAGGFLRRSQAELNKIGKVTKMVILSGNLCQWYSDI